MLADEKMLEIAERYLSKMVDNKIETVIILEETIKKPYGNIYRYQSKEYLLTRDFNKALSPGTPFLVEKSTGRVVNFASPMSLENNMKHYENRTMGKSSDLYWYPDEDRFPSK